MPTPDTTPNNDAEPTPELKYNAPELLLDYLRSQFEAAYQKERSDDKAGNTASNGSFYQRKILLEEDEDSIIKATTRVVMRPPFSTEQESANDEFAEVYAVFLRESDGYEVVDEGCLFADLFLVRTHRKGNFSSFELVDENGCVPVDLSDMDISKVLGTDKQSSTNDEEIDSIFAPFKRANELLALLETYNIVAIND